MSNALYFKDMDKRDENNNTQMIYRVEECKMLLEIIDKNHPMGLPNYFSSIKQRDDFIKDKKDHLVRISEKEVKNIINLWRS